MIPKIAHFHWTGPPMSWLRMASIASFVKHNPEWQVRVIGTPPDIREYGLEYAHEADWTWWRTLVKEGGFQVATDIVFINPVPDEWLHKSMNACLNGGKVIHQFAMLGAEPGNVFLRRCEAACEAFAKNVPKHKIRYQSFGVDLLAGVSKSDKNGMQGLIKNGVIKSFYNQPMHALCPVNCGDIDKLWHGWQFPLHPKTIGVHWYGGYPKSNIGQHDSDSNAFIIKLAHDQLAVS